MKRALTDFFFSTAGVGVLTTSSIDKWDEAVDINVKAAMRLSKLSLPHLEASAQAGKVPLILNISSISGKNHYGFLAPCTCVKTLYYMIKLFLLTIRCLTRLCDQTCIGWIFERSLRCC